MDWRSPALRWKAAVAAFAIAVALLDVWALSRVALVFSPQSHGSIAAGLAHGKAGWYRVRSLEAASPLASAGVKAGDEIRFDLPGDAYRYLEVGETIGLVARNAAGSRHLEVVAVAAPVDAGEVADFLLMIPGSLLILAVGTLVGWRGADSLPLRALSASLLSQTLHLASALLPGGALQGFVALRLGTVSATVAYVCFMYFAMAYAQWPLLGERRGRIAYRVYVALFVGLDALSMARSVSPAWADVIPPLQPFAYAENLFSAAFSFLVLALAWHRAQGVRRERLGWIVACLGGIDIAYFGANAARVSGSPSFIVASDIVASLLVSGGNVGLAYAVLRHRVLDFGFAVNRAMVYGTTSLLLAAAFMLASQVLNRLLQFEAREDHRFLDAAIGLGLALTARQAVRWVDPRVQRIFFRRWHAAAGKLAAFRIDAIHGKEPQALRVEFLQAVIEYAEADGAAFYRKTDDGALRRTEAIGAALPGEVDAGDALVAALATTSGAVEVARTGSTVPAALALSMKAHGRLVGVVLVGAKPEGEPFRPDERKQLAQTAQQVGIELELGRLRDLESRMQRATPTPSKKRRRGKASTR